MGFVQYGNSDVNHVISGKKVHYVKSEKGYLNLINRLSVNAILFATEEEAREEQDRIIKFSMEAHLKLLYAPPVDETESRPTPFVTLRLRTF